LNVASLLYVGAAQMPGSWLSGRLNGLGWHVKFSV